jgi:hypothetical protein
MRRRTALVAALAVLVGTPAIATAATAPAPAAPDPTYAAGALADRAASDKRGADQDANPAYAKLMAPLIAQFAAEEASGSTIDPAIDIDPFLPGWSGTITPASFVNRYGATLRGNFYVPAKPWTDSGTGRQLDRLPVVLFLPGFSSDDLGYRGVLEQLADAGYIVVYVAPQGQGASDVDPNPKSEYCDPNGAWKQPQENGLTEQGSCAGYDGTPDAVEFPDQAMLDDAVGSTPLAGTPAAGAASLAGGEADIAKARTTGDWSAEFDAMDTAFRHFRTRYVFAAYDAAAWLHSDNNPLRDEMDLAHLGIVGHSAGSDAALVAGNGDQLHRFGAAVVWDDYGTPPDSITPTVPTLIFQTEQEQLAGPWLPRPDPRLWPSYRVPFGLLALRGSTHQEWSYIPYSANDPFSTLTDSNGLAGEVSLHETVAWFDRFLKTGPDAQVADQRLWQRTLDSSTDASSRGQGTFDPVTLQNVPYAAGGTDLGTDLSDIFASELYLDGRSCPNWQAGC